MKSIRSAILVGCFVAFTAAAGDAGAQGADVFRGEMHCRQTTTNHLGHAVVTAGTQAIPALVQLTAWQGDAKQLRVHRSVLDRVLQPPSAWKAQSPSTATPYVRLSGWSITPETDGVVRMFANNSLADMVRNGPLPESDYWGIKARVGRYGEKDADARHSESEVYVRLVIDWRYRTRHQDRMSLHRAALVVSQETLVMGEAKESFYRFFPSQRPFLMLACIIVGAKGT